jgi:hypothetical protein
LLAEDSGTDFNVRARLVQDGYFVPPGNGSDKLLSPSFFPHIREIDIEHTGFAHGAPPLLTGCGKSQFMHNTPLKPFLLTSMSTKHQDAQKGRPARPQRVKTGGVPFGVR